MSATISIFGTGHASPGEPVYETACDLGRALAQQGFAIANGAYGGTMQAAAYGARQAHGHVIGVTCTALGRSGPNPYITQVIQRHSLPARLHTLVELGDGYVILPGGTGTLLELALVWELTNKALINPPKPIILWGPAWQRVLDTVAEQDAQATARVTTVDSVAAACRQLLIQLRHDKD